MINAIVYVGILFLFILTSEVASEEYTIDSSDLHAALSSPPIKTAYGKSSEVRIKYNSYLSDIACDPKHTLFATAFQNGQISINNIRTGVEVKRIQAHADSAEIAWFSENGKVLATTSRKDTARFWDVFTGKELFSTEFVPRAYPVLFKSRYLLLTGSSLSVVDLKTGKVQTDVLRSTSGKTVIDSKRNKLFILSGNAVRIFEITIDQDLLYFDQTHREKLQQYGRSFAWMHYHKSDNSLIIASKRGIVVKLDAETFKGTRVIDAVDSIHSFDVNGGHFIISGRPKTNAGNRGSRLTSKRDTVFAGTIKHGITHYLNLYTNKESFACFREDGKPNAIVGTMTNVASTPLDKKE